jgi:hypothetical protein
MCCFLLLFPVGTVRAVVRVQLPTENESRTPVEHEIQHEVMVGQRGVQRRQPERGVRQPISIARAAAALRPASFPTRLAALRCAEQDLRNGVGSPLRC